MNRSTRRKRVSLIPRYLPSVLTRRDRKIQYDNVVRARRLYPRGIYVSRTTVKSFPHRESKHVLRAKKTFKVRAIGATPALAKASGCSIPALRAILRKGEGAYYSSGSRPNQTAQSWGVARLASALTAGKAAGVDYHILHEGCKRGSPGWKSAQKMKKQKMKS